MKCTAGIPATAILLISGMSAHTIAQTATPDIAPVVVAAGGGFIAGTATSIHATLGQPLATEDDALPAGFWHTKTASAQVGTNARSTETGLPSRYALQQNYPNPFTATTTIRYELPEPTIVELTVLNILGQAVDVLFSGEQPAGRYTFLWDGNNTSGSNLSSGVYLYRISSPEFVQERRMVLLR